MFAVLDHLVAHREGATLAELAASCGTPKSSLLGLLGGMVGERSIVRHEDGRYAIGPRLIGLAMRTVAGAELRTVARPFLDQLMRATAETAALGLLTPEGDLFTYVERVESFQPVRYAIAVGERRELHCTAIGKVLLAWLDKPRLDAWLVAHPLRRFTPNTITSAARLRAELRAVREEGLARTDGERFVDAAGIGAPVFLADGTAGAGLLVAGPQARMRERAAHNERVLRQVAAELSDALGASARRTGGSPR